MISSPADFAHVHLRSLEEGLQETEAEYPFRPARRECIHGIHEAPVRQASPQTERESQNDGHPAETEWMRRLLHDL